MYRGYHDPDKKTPTREKVLAAAEAYERHFGHPATVVLTSHQDALDVADEELGLEVVARGFIQKNIFYAGTEVAR